MGLGYPLPSEWVGMPSHGFGQPSRSNGKPPFPGLWTPPFPSQWEGLFVLPVAMGRPPFPLQRVAFPLQWEAPPSRCNG